AGTCPPNSPVSRQKLQQIRENATESCHVLFTRKRDHYEMKRRPQDKPGNRETLELEMVPLVVDLDGTLLRTDLLLESVLRLLKQKLWTILAMPFWLLRGRAHLKRQISQLVRMEFTPLPMNEELLAWLKEEKSRGRTLVLATASDYLLARS